MTKIAKSTKAFIGATEKERRRIISQMKKRADVEDLLKKVATAANIHQQGITQHPYLQGAHRQLKALKKRLHNQAELIMQMNFLKHDLDIVDEDNAKLHDQLAQAEQARENLRQKYEEELNRWSDSSRRLEDEVNRLQSQNEHLQEMVEAALDARCQYATLAESLIDAMETDVRLAELGIEFEKE